MLERRINDAIVRAICWLHLAAAFSILLINVASAEIARGAANRIIAANASCNATLGDLTVGLFSSDPAAVITQELPAGAQLGRGDTLVTFTSAETNGDFTCIAVITVVDTLPPVVVCATNKVVECGSVWSFDKPLASDGCAGTNVTLMMRHHSQSERETSSSLIWNAEDLFCLGYLPSSAKPGKTKSTTEP